MTWQQTNDRQLARFEAARRSLAAAAAVLEDARLDHAAALREYTAAGAALAERLRLTPCGPVQLALADVPTLPPARALDPDPDPRPWSRAQRKAQT